MITVLCCMIKLCVTISDHELIRSILGVHVHMHYIVIYLAACAS